jgi:hypothetical protein
MEAEKGHWRYSVKLLAMMNKKQVATRMFTLIADDWDTFV